MKLENATPLNRRCLITAIILLAGLGSAMLIYLTADNASDSALVTDFESSKRYMHDMELYGGKANVLAAELRNWFMGLWHGRSLAATVACITIVTALGFFYVSYQLEAHRRDEDKPDGSG